MEKESTHYKGCRIDYWVHEQDGLFTAEAVVHSDVLDEERVPHISGKAFTNVGDAEKYILDEAKTWIDAKLQSLGKNGEN